MTVELNPGNPSIYEILVWVWALTLYLEEIRQVVYIVQLLSCAKFGNFVSNQWLDSRFYDLMVFHFLLKLTIQLSGDGKDNDRQECVNCPKAYCICHRVFFVPVGSRDIR